MESQQIVKEFLCSAREYFIQKHEIGMNSLQRYMQILSATDDLSVFDTGSCEAVEFYTSLHELMSGHDAHAEIVWCAVSVLQRAVINPDIRTALIHKYKFMPVLSKLLSSQIIPEKQHRVLRLLEELSFGIQITWQESYLATLIKLLVKYIENNELTSVALGILVNICHQNTPVVNILTQCIDTKLLFKSVLKTQEDDMKIQVQLFSLMMILDHLSPDINNQEFERFVQLTLSMMEKALKMNDVILLQYTVNFYKDMKENANAMQALMSYSEYYTNIETLINLLENEDDTDKNNCILLFMDFLQLLLVMNVVDLTNLHPNMVRFAIKWVHNTNVSIKALDLLTSIAKECKMDDSNSEISSSALLDLFEENLQILISMCDFCGQSFVPNVQSDTITFLFALLQELNKSHRLSTLIQVAVPKVAFVNLFSSLVSSEQTNSHNLFEKTSVTLYIQAMRFLADLSIVNSEWFEIYSELLSKRQILQVIAVALYSGDSRLKEQAVFLIVTSRFQENCINGFVKCMTDLNQFFMLGPINNANQLTIASHALPSESASFLNSTHNSEINEFIRKINKEYNRNQIKDISTSTVIEMYQYKLSHVERSMQASLEVATSQSTYLNHKLAQLSAELNRLHHLLFSNQQIIEGERMEFANVKSKLQEATCAANISFSKYNKLKEEMSLKIQCIKELSEAKEKLMMKTEDLEKQHHTLESQLKLAQDRVNRHECTIDKLEEELTGKNVEIKKLEDVIVKNEKLVKKQNEEIDKIKSEKHSLDRTMANQVALITGLERTLKDKNKEMLEAQKKISELEKMRDVIYEISAGKMKVDKS
uniref:Protein CIP2A n=1 Tax=Clastoptera arizonana TaxID=38151 RepID=A0A1B6DP45_9HEMI